MMGVVVSGGVSGGHLNPAITVAIASVGKFPWKKVPHYLAGQYLGAFLGSATVFLVVNLISYMRSCPQSST